MKKSVFGIKRILFGMLTLFIMGIIFYSSAQNGSASAGQSGRVTRLIQKIFFPSWSHSEPEVFERQLYALQFLIRKAAHFSVFLLLGVFALEFLTTFSVKWVARMGITVLFIVFYAASDEVHQFFSDGRSMMVFDVLVDSVGGTLGMFTASACSLLSETKKRSIQERNEK